VAYRNFFSDEFPARFCDGSCCLEFFPTFLQSNLEYQVQKQICKVRDFPPMKENPPFTTSRAATRRHLSLPFPILHCSGHYYTKVPPPLERSFRDKSKSAGITSLYRCTRLHSPPEVSVRRQRASRAVTVAHAIHLSLFDTCQVLHAPRLPYCQIIDTSALAATSSATSSVTLTVDR
jgi:hypothetical protein